MPGEHTGTTLMKESHTTSTIPHRFPPEPEMRYCPWCRSELSRRTVEGEERVACSSATCSYVFYNNPTPVVAAIVEYNEKIILAHKKGFPETWYGIIAGFLEKGETPEQAVLREIKEEVGLAGDTLQFIGHYSFFERNQLILAFHVKAQGEICLGDELDRIKLVHPDEVRPWPHGTGPAVRDWLAQRKDATVPQR